MTVELETYDLIRMVMGSQLSSYEMMDHPLIKVSGRYWGGFNDKWEFEKDKLRLLTDEQLWEIYNLCKKEHIDFYKKYNWEII